MSIAQDRDEFKAASLLQKYGPTMSRAPESRKRKRDNVDGEYQLAGSFVVQAHPSLPSSKTQKLTPRFLLPRSSLPLAYLDIGDSSGSRLFSTHTNLLESDSEKPCHQPTVLIAQCGQHSYLYAIEKVQDQFYALCKLGDWVTIEILQKIHGSSVHKRPASIEDCHDRVAMAEAEWWRPAEVKRKLEPQKNQPEAPRLAGGHHVTLDLSVPSGTKRSPSPIPPQLNAVVLEPAMLVETVKDICQEPSDLLETIKFQYQEALYISKASLAYFAKGPLSRARGTFHLHDGTEWDRSHLIKHLRSMILPLPMMDRKFRETLPGLIKDVPFNALSEDESVPILATVKKKIRKSKKTLPGKNGLYSGEEVSIVQWWLSRETDDLCESAEAREESTKKVLHEQRARETQLQIILALEMIALEASSPNRPVEPGVSDSYTDTREVPKGKTKKPKEPQNLHTLLDLLVDRLCIWQSMSLEDTQISNENRPVSQRGVHTGGTASKTDHLRQFCIDVVIPFYGARLPELSTALCQKLGWPKDKSPKRAPVVKSASASSNQAKPGAAIQRPPARKVRRTLERVLTEERSLSRKSTPSLSRSATDSVLPRLKREMSDTSLSAIPLNRASVSRRFSQREVDLQSASQAAEAKLKKKATIEQELQGAIQALKRPNARMAVKELVEAAEKRAVGHHPRKPKNPIRNPLAQRVQVMATPSKNRQGNVFSVLPRMARGGEKFVPEFEPELEEVPPSSISPIACSATKNLDSQGLAGKNSTYQARRGLPLVEQTPTRGPNKFSSRPHFSATFGSEKKTSQAPLPPSFSRPRVSTERDQPYALPQWPVNIQATPLTSSKELGTAYTSQIEEQAIHETPVKKPPAVGLSPEFAQLQSSQEKEDSIYARLGWDDEVDELS